jgi:hypothetical protein
MRSKKVGSNKRVNSTDRNGNSSSFGSYNGTLKVNEAARLQRVISQAENVVVLYSSPKKSPKKRRGVS